MRAEPKLLRLLVSKMTMTSHGTQEAHTKIVPRDKIAQIDIGILKFWHTSQSYIVRTLSQLLSSSSWVCPLARRTAMVGVQRFALW